MVSPFLTRDLALDQSHHSHSHYPDSPSPRNLTYIILLYHLPVFSGSPFRVPSCSLTRLASLLSHPRPCHSLTNLPHTPFSLFISSTPAIDILQSVPLFCALLFTTSSSHPCLCFYKSELELDSEMDLSVLVSLSVSTYIQHKSVAHLSFFSSFFLLWIWILDFLVTFFALFIHTPSLACI